MLRRIDLNNIKIRVIGEKENIPKRYTRKIDKLVEKTKEQYWISLKYSF